MATTATQFVILVPTVAASTASALRYALKIHDGVDISVIMTIARCNSVAAVLLSVRTNVV